MQFLPDIQENSFQQSDFGDDFLQMTFISYILIMEKLIDLLLKPGAIHCLRIKSVRVYLSAVNRSHVVERSFFLLLRGGKRFFFYCSKFSLNCVFVSVINNANFYSRTWS